MDVSLYPPMSTNALVGGYASASGVVSVGAAVVITAISKAVIHGIPL